MYLAEIHGKVSSKIERMEDILTSNVFSFFKYSNRRIFLRQFLKEIEIFVSETDADKAEFIFWPELAEKTEPDLVIKVGDFYILFEAKYFSGFRGETEKTEAQILREIEGGRIEAKNNDEIFYLVTITADPYYKKEKFSINPSEFNSNFRWTNWQRVCSFLEKVLKYSTSVTPRERDFAFDLYRLLDKKNLRAFKGISCINNFDIPTRQYENLFFEAGTAMFRGSFIGFENSLSSIDAIQPIERTIFFDHRVSIGYFASLQSHKNINTSNDNVFWKGNCIMANHDDINNAFEFIHQFYLEVSYLVKEIEGLLKQEEEKFVIGKPVGYGISTRGSTGLESNNVYFWLPSKFSIFFVPEDVTVSNGQTKTKVDDKLKILYFRFILNDKKFKQPLIYSGVFHNIILKEQKWNRFEQAMGPLAGSDEKVFSDPLTVDYEDAKIIVKGKFIKNELLTINNSETIFHKVLEPSLRLYREI